MELELSRAMRMIGFSVSLLSFLTNGESNKMAINVTAKARKANNNPFNFLKTGIV
jgi:hypothetical protein